MKIKRFYKYIIQVHITGLTHTGLTAQGQLPLREIAPNKNKSKTRNFRFVGHLVANELSSLFLLAFNCF